MSGDMQRMAPQCVRRAGNSLVVTIPKDEAERLGIAAGDMVEISIQPLELRPKMDPELRAAFEASWAINQAGYQYLAEH
jgi:antitoxin component of MazEF toxin-antitoxin module